MSDRPFFRKLSPFLISVFILSGCEKRDRLTVPTQTLRISPTAAAVRTGTTKSFSVSVVSPSGEAQDVLPTWSISPASVGTLSPSTGLLSQFTAGQSLGAQGVITVSHEGLTAQAQVTVVPATGDPATAYGIFSESLTNGFLFDVANPPNPDGAELIAFNCGQGDTATLSAGTGVGEYSEGLSSLKVAVSIPLNGGVCPGTAFLLGSPTPTAQNKDMSAFAGGSLKFDIRAPLGRNVRIKVESFPTGDDQNMILDGVYTVFDDQFHSVTIPLASVPGLQLGAFRGVTFVALFGSAAENYNFYIDNVRIEQP